MPASRPFSSLSYTILLNLRYQSCLNACVPGVLIKCTEPDRCWVVTLSEAKGLPRRTPRSFASLRMTCPVVGATIHQDEDDPRSLHYPIQLSRFINYGCIIYDAMRSLWAWLNVDGRGERVARWTECTSISAGLNIARAKLTTSASSNSLHEKISMFIMR